MRDRDRQGRLQQVSPWKIRCAVRAPFSESLVGNVHDGVQAAAGSRLSGPGPTLVISHLRASGRCTPGRSVRYRRAGTRLDAKAAEALSRLATATGAVGGEQANRFSHVERLLAEAAAN